MGDRRRDFLDGAAHPGARADVRHLRAAGDLEGGRAGVADLGRARAGERHRIWPIVQLSDWGEEVPVAQVKEALDHGNRAPATGVLVFAWGSLVEQPAKVEAMSAFFLEIA